ncbi:MAG: DUF2946 family protein [Burkholderiales bacterium]
MLVDRSRFTFSRNIATLALFAMLLQALLPGLRMMSASAGELRAEAVLATVLCSKQKVSSAERVAALLNPWQQHTSKSKHRHCDSCLQGGTFVAAVCHHVGLHGFNTKAEAVPFNFPASFASASALIPPSRAPPCFS